MPKPKSSALTKAATIATKGTNGLRGVALFFTGKDGARLLCDVRQQREIAGALDRLCEFALFLGRNGGDP